jgi:hypothetical protein
MMAGSVLARWLAGVCLQKVFSIVIVMMAMLLWLG